MRNDTYFETFAGAVDGAMAAAESNRAVLTKPTELWNLCQEPLFYTQTRSLSFQLDTLKGKPTKKYFHVSIYRLESGRYELTSYVL